MLTNVDAVYLPASLSFPLHPSARKDHPDLPAGVPWEMVAPHEAQARKNHGQSLNRLAERGGLSAMELTAVLCGRDCFELAGKMTEKQAVAAVKHYLASFYAGVEPTVRA